MASPMMLLQHHHALLKTLCVLRRVIAVPVSPAHTVHSWVLTSAQRKSLARLLHQHQLRAPMADVLPSTKCAMTIAAKV